MKKSDEKLVGSIVLKKTITEKGMIRFLLKIQNMEFQSKFLFAAQGSDAVFDSLKKFTHFNLIIERE